MAAIKPAASLYFMEQQLTNEEIVRVFAMYRGCEVRYGYDNHQQSGILVGNDERYGLQVFNAAKVSAPYHFVRTELLALLLTPLSEISDEDAIEVAKITSSHRMSNDEMIWYGRQVINFHLLDESFDYKSEYDTAKSRAHLISVYPSLLISVFQYLISKGYAVTLFFGVGHWANGKTAIELNIAKEKTASN